MATLNGVNIFGISVRVIPGPVPRASHEVAYPGVNGVEHVDMGGRGRTTRVTGTLTGATRYALKAARLLLESYHDGRAYAFTDSEDDAWANVVMGAPEFEAMRPGPIFSMRYAVTLKHLTAS